MKLLSEGNRKLTSSINRVQYGEQIWRKGEVSPVRDLLAYLMPVEHICMEIFRMGGLG